MTKEQKKLKDVMDEKYVAFLLLESMYESGKINKATYENVLKEKRNYIEEKYNLKDVSDGMSRVILSDLSENKVVLPTNVSTFDRNRQRSVVFYGRVSTDDE